jgi:hypothetical protein
MSKTARGLLKLGPRENSTRVIDGIQSRKLSQVANRNHPEIVFAVRVQVFAARERDNGLKDSGESGAVASRTREKNCPELGIDFRDPLSKMDMFNLTAAE